MHKVSRQEMRVKVYAKRKISLIMKKTTVDFFSVASRVYHCFFFLYLPLVISDVDLI